MASDVGIILMYSSQGHNVMGVIHESSRFVKDLESESELKSKKSETLTI